MLLTRKTANSTWLHLARNKFYLVTYLLVWVGHCVDAVTDHQPLPDDSVDHVTPGDRR